MVKHPSTDYVRVAVGIALEQLSTQAEALRVRLASADPAPACVVAQLLIDLDKVQAKLSKHKVRLDPPSKNGKGGAS